jgi:hypothetical protein
MAAPTLSSSSPADSAAAVFINATITATFSEDLLASSVNSSTAILRSISLDETVDAQVTVSGSIITIQPWNFLIAESVYTLTLVGADLGLTTGAIKDTATETDLATTVVITFTTGDQVQTPELGKTEEETALEGGAFLPTDVVVTDTTFRVTNSIPLNHSWSISRHKPQLIITMSNSVDSTTVVDGTSFYVTQTAFLDEEGLLALSGADGYAFQYEDPTGMDFSDVTGALAVTGSQITWTKDTSRDWASNTCVEVFLGSTIADTGGSTLAQDQKITFYIEPFPVAVGVRAIRSELGTMIPTTYLDDYIGLRTWFRTMETWEETNRYIDIKRDFITSRPFKQYIKCRAAMDIIDDIRADKDLGAGVSKTLGDFKVSYFPQGAEVTSRKEKTLEKECQKCWQSMIGYMNRPAVSVKGRGEVDVRGSRIWRMPSAFNFQRNVHISDPYPTANTAHERGSKYVGYADVE